jgi:hypothetical protein
MTLAEVEVIFGYGLLDELDDDEDNTIVASIGQTQAYAEWRKGNFTVDLWPHSFASIEAAKDMYKVLGCLLVEAEKHKGHKSASYEI